MKHLLFCFILILLCSSAFSQKRLSKKLVRNRWISDCIKDDCDTINLKRIKPFATYKWQRVISFKKNNQVLYYYYFNPQLNEPVMICGTAELELSRKSNYTILSENKIQLDIEANILLDRFYKYKYKKDFLIERLSKNEYRLVNHKTHYYESSSER